MRLATLKQYRSTFFAPGSEPSIGTVRAQAKDGTLPGVLQGRLWYIDLDALERKHGIVAGLDAEARALLESPELDGLG